jgi:hypothetical protein
LALPDFAILENFETRIDRRDLDVSKREFAEVWVQRREFVNKYPASLSGPKFIDALLLTAQNSSEAELSSLRPTLIDDFNTYGSRARIAYLLLRIKPSERRSTTRHSC